MGARSPEIGVIPDSGPVCHRPGAAYRVRNSMIPKPQLSPPLPGPLLHSEWRRRWGAKRPAGPSGWAAAWKFPVVARVQKRCRALLHRTPRRWRAVRGFPEPPPVAGDGEPAHQPSLTSTAAARRSAKRHRPIRRGRFLYRDGISRRADPPGNPEGCWRLARRTTPGQPFCVSPPRRWRGIPLVCH